MNMYVCIWLNSLLFIVCDVCQTGEKVPFSCSHEVFCCVSTVATTYCSLLQKLVFRILLKLLNTCVVYEKLTACIGKQGCVLDIGSIL